LLVTSLMEQHGYGSYITISLATVRYCDVISDNCHSTEFMHSDALIILKIGLIFSVYPRKLLRETLRCHSYPSVIVLIFYFERRERGTGGRSAESFETTRSPLLLRYFARGSTCTARRTKQANKQTWLQIQRSPSISTVWQSNFILRFHVIPYSVRGHPFSSIKSIELAPSGLQMGDLLLSQALCSAVHPLSEISHRITFTGPARLLS